MYFKGEVFLSDKVVSGSLVSTLLLNFVGKEDKGIVVSTDQSSRVIAR